MEISERVYDLLVDTEIVVDVMLGSTSISVGEFLKLTEGDIISLHKPAGSGGEIYVNSRIIGTGDIIATITPSRFFDSTILNFLKWPRQYNIEIPKKASINYH